MDIKNTQTEKNLVKALTGECLANNRYSFYAKIAKNEGYEQIADIFEETSNNEREHAKLFYKYLGQRNCEITNQYTTGIGNTENNLKLAFEAEHEENSFLYPEFGQTAKDEGFLEIAETFFNVAHVEKHHELRYITLYENISNKSVFKKEEEVFWKCLKCGLIFKGLEAPKNCPLCKHPRGYFELLCDNY